MKGYLGWDGKYPTDKLQIEMSEDTVRVLNGEGVEKNLVDVGARAMMLWFRETVKGEGDG